MANADTVWAALPAQNKDEWAAVGAVAEAVGMGYSTAGKWLAKLVAEGRAEGRKDGRATVYRQIGSKAGRPAKGTVKAEPAKTVDMKTARRAAKRLETELQANADAIGAALDAAEPQLWVAIWRKGINHHVIDGPAHTMCGRSTVAGGQFVAVPPDDSELCPQCAKALEHRYAETTVDAAEPSAPATQPVSPAAPPSPAGGGVADVAAWMSDVRPVSAPPATPTPARRRRSDAPTEARQWARGELRDAVLAHLQSLPGDVNGWQTPTQIAHAIGSAHVGPVATNCVRMVAAGTALQSDDAPVRYRAA